MNKYTIHINSDASTDVEVLAKTKEEALEKAKKTEIKMKGFDVVPNEIFITDEKKLQEIDEMKKKAESILKAAEALCLDIKLDPWPFLTVKVWNGYEMKERKELLELIYWDEDRDEIGLETERCPEITLSDLPLIEQYMICDAILKDVKSKMYSQLKKLPYF